MNGGERKTSEDATKHRPIVLTVLAAMGMAIVYAIGLIINLIIGRKS